MPSVQPSQYEHYNRSAFLALKQGRQSMLDYIKRARHLASCIVTDLIDTVTQVHVFVTGMRLVTNVFIFEAEVSVIA